MMSHGTHKNQGCASGCAFMTRANGRLVFHNGCFRCNVPARTTCCSNRRSVNVFTSHDGRFGHLVVGQELSELLTHVCCL